MGLYDDIPWYSTPRKKDYDPDHDGYVEIRCDGRTFRGRTEAEANRKIDEYFNDKNVRTLISAGMSVDEIRLHLGDPRWEPTEDHLELLKLQKKVLDESQGFAVADFDDTDFDGEEGIVGADREAFLKLLRTKGQYVVLMTDGYYHEINTFGNDTFSMGEIVSQEPGGNSTAAASVSKRSSGKATVSVVPKDSLVCIDGSNVIGIDDELRTKVLRAIVEALTDAGYKYKVFVDKTIFSWLRNKKQDEAGASYISDAEKNGFVIVAPNKAEADGQILQLAEFEKNVHIITNDRYRDYAEMHPWLNDMGSENRVHGINIVPMGLGKFRILIAGFNLDITVQQ